MPAGGRRATDPGPSFYAYTYPAPPGFERAAFRPFEAFFDGAFGEILLPYDDVRSSADPDAAVLAFLESTYAAGADLAGWDRSALEPKIRPQRPPRAPWTIPTLDGPGNPAPARGKLAEK